MQSATEEASTPPAATAASTSRSVRMPRRRPPSRTSAAPILCSCISFAASQSVALESTVTRVRVMVSLTGVSTAFVTISPSFSVAQLGSPAGHVLGQLLANRLVDRRRLVLLQLLSPDLTRPRGRVLAAVSRPPLVVLGRRQQRPVETLPKTLERAHCAQEVPTVADLLVRGERECLVVHLERLELALQHPQDLDVDDELL